MPIKPSQHRKSGKISGENCLFASIQPEPSLQVCESILLFLTGQVGIDIHRRSDVGMSHNLLYDLQRIGIGSVFAHPRAEGMPEMMGREVRQQHGSSPFHVCLFFFGGVVVAANTLNRVTRLREKQPQDKKERYSP